MSSINLLDKIGEPRRSLIVQRSDPTAYPTNVDPDVSSELNDALQSFTDVYMPAGKYIISKPNIRIKTDWTRMHGDGWATELAYEPLQPITADDQVLWVAGPNGLGAAVHLSDFRMSNRNAIPNGVALHGIGIGHYGTHRYNNCSFRNLHVSGFTFGMELRECQECVFENVCLGGNSTGLWNETDCTNISFRNCSFSHNKIHGVYLQSGRGFSFASCVFEYNEQYGIMIEANPHDQGTSLEYICFWQPWLEGNYGGNAGALVKGRGLHKAKRVHFIHAAKYSGQSIVIDSNTTEECTDFP